MKTRILATAEMLGKSSSKGFPRRREAPEMFGNKEKITVRTKILFSIVMLCVFGAMVALAADVTGKWVASYEGRGGNQMQVTFDLKQSGSDLTGTMTAPGRGGAAGEPVEISEGKVDGDNVSFAVVRSFGDREFKTTYKGAVSGMEMKITMERMGRDGTPMTTDMVAKKQ